MSHRLPAFVAAFALGGCIILGAAPAHAADYDLREYQLTAPSGVLYMEPATPGGAAPANGEVRVWQDGNRNIERYPAGTQIKDVPVKYTTPVTPISGTTGRAPGIGKVGGLLGQATLVAPIVGSIADVIQPGFLQKRSDLACENKTWTGGLQRFFASLVGAPGCDTAAVSAEIQNKPTPDVLAPAVSAGWPYQNSNTSGSTTSTSEPFWSDVLRNGEKEGWVYPVKVSGSTVTWYARAYEVMPDGSAGAPSATNATALSGTNTSNSARSASTDPRCAVTLTICVRAAGMGGALTGRTYALSYNQPGGTQTATPAVMPIPPYAPRTVGGVAPVPAPATGGSADVQQRTTIFDDEGRSSSCLTRIFKETDATIPAPCAPIIPSPWGTEVRRSTELVPVGAPNEVKPLTNTEYSPAYIDWKKTYPQCSVQICLLELQDADGQDCMTGDPSRCRDWQRRADAQPGTFTCRYATVVVDLAECRAYAPAFEPDAIQNGSVYAPGKSDVPGSAPSVLPGGGTSAVPDVPGAPNAGACFPSGWGILNPVEWVLKPVQCALSYAFIPPATSVATLRVRSNAAFQGTALGTVTGMVNGFGSMFSGVGGGCQGPPWRIHAFGVDTTLYPFNACSEPRAGMASAVKGMGAFSITVWGALAIIRNITAVFGYIGYGNANGAIGAMSSGTAEKK